MRLDRLCLATSIAVALILPARAAAQTQDVSGTLYLSTTTATSSTGEVFLMTAAQYSVFSDCTKGATDAEPCVTKAQPLLRSAVGDDGAFDFEDVDSGSYYLGGLSIATGLATTQEVWVPGVKTDIYLDPFEFSTPGDPSKLSQACSDASKKHTYAAAAQLCLRAAIIYGHEVFEHPENSVARGSCEALTGYEFAQGGSLFGLVKNYKKALAMTLTAEQFFQAALQNTNTPARETVKGLLDLEKFQEQMLRKDLLRP